MSLLADLLRGLAGVAGSVGPGGMLAVAVLAVVVGVLAWAADKVARAVDGALRAWARLPLWARQVLVVLAGLQALRSAPPKWLGAAAMCLALAWYVVGCHQAKLFDRRDAAAGLTPAPMADKPAWESHLRWVRERAERSRIDSAVRRLPGNKRTSRPTRSVRSEPGGRTRTVLPAPPGTVPEAFAEALRNGAADGALFDALGRVARVHEARVLPDGGVEAVIDGPLTETQGPAAPVSPGVIGFDWDEDAP